MILSQQEKKEMSMIYKKIKSLRNERNKLKKEMTPLLIRLNELKDFKKED